MTIFTMQSQIDWSSKRAGLYGAFWVLTIWGLMAWHFGFQVPSRLWCLLPLFVCLYFCGILVHNTDEICKRCTPDQYVLGGIMFLWFRWRRGYAHEIAMQDF
mmetsp:Transcript_46331/g.100519  ORF Transcript_46331/g.100519 Transcript_46331/m.100519 type:complete len:102 (+) Transcript_46331:3-308(+)